MQKRRIGTIHFLTQKEVGRQHLPICKVYYPTTHILRELKEMKVTDLPYQSL